MEWNGKPEKSVEPSAAPSNPKEVNMGLFHALVPIPKLGGSRIQIFQGWEFYKGKRKSLLNA
jgi:hypothetical protein